MSNTLFSFRSQSGQVARLLLVLAVVVLVAIFITYLAIKVAEKPAKPVTQGEEKIPQPEYEYQLGNIRFVFESAINRGNTLKAADATNKDFYSQKDLTTTEKFIIVTVGAQNKGNLNTDRGAWDIGNIIDSDGRNFVPIEDYIVNAWLPKNNLCGSLLKPAFNPSPCVKVYEVSKESTGLKIQVLTGATNNSANDFSANRRISHNLDMIVR